MSGARKVVRKRAVICCKMFFLLQYSCAPYIKKKTDLFKVSGKKKVLIFFWILDFNCAISSLVLPLLLNKKKTNC